MKPIREIVIREYLPGMYECNMEGRRTSCTSRNELRLYLCRELGDLPDPRVEELEEKVDMLEEELKEDVNECYEADHV